MPLKETQLIEKFGKHKVSKSRLNENEWYDQGSDNYHFGLPIKKNLWVRRIIQSHRCSNHTIWLFLLLHVDKICKIKKIETAVHQVYNDGSYDELGVPFFGEDLENAKTEIQKVITEV